jgi:mRNA-degrading endonuclease RelE of RelBE toxin-antitoxin system
MKRFRLEIARAVRDLLIHLPPNLKRKVKAVLQALAENPYQAKALRGDLAGLRSFWVVRSRIILRIKGSTVEIIAFGPRKDIYQRAASELRTTLRSRRKETKS